MTVTWPIDGDADYSDVIRGSIDDALQNLQDQINALPVLGTGFLLAINNLGDLQDIALARANLDVFSKGELPAQISARIVDIGLQPLDTGLTALSGKTPAADRGVYYTGATTSALFTLTAAARNLLDDADAAAMQVTLGLVPGTNVQVFNSNLLAIGNLTPVNDDVLQRKGGVWTNRTPALLKADLNITATDVGLGNVNNTSDANKPVSTATTTQLNLKLAIASNLSELSATAATARTNLGLGTMAVLGSAASGGDITGTWPTITVAKVNGIAFSGTPTAGQVPVATSGTAAAWQTAPLGNVPVASDVIWDAKGDLAVGTGADTSAKLTAGANDTILVADSTVSPTGLKWAAPGVVRTALGLGAGTMATLSSTSTGDITGVWPSATVSRINGVAVTTTPTIGSVLTATGTTSATWQAISTVLNDPIFDLKGDIVVGTGPDAAARLAAGADDTILMADSTTGSGLKWGAPATVLAALGLGAGTMGTLSSTAGGDLTGTWPNTIVVAKVKGVTIGATAPTTGQILIATSATTAAWSVSPSSNIPVANDVIWNAKGDLAVASGPDAALTLTAGANNTLLMADTTTGTGLTVGLRWADAATVRGAIGLGTMAVLGSGATTDLSGTWPNITVSKINGVTLQGAPTAGQILTASSGTVATWAAAPNSNIPVANDVIWNAKGDLGVGIANDQAQALTVGANDTMLLADSTTATGLKWSTPAIVKIALALNNVDNTSDANKPVSTLQGIAITARVPLTLYDANTILAANTDDTPLALTVGQQTLVGRITGGVITALTPGQVQTMLALVPGTNVEAWSIDLDAIRNLVPVNNDIIQRKAGAWTNSTPAVLRTDMGLDAPTFTGVATAPALAASGIAGMTQPTRLVGAIAAGVLPLAGVFAVGDLISRNNGVGLLQCTTAGTIGGVPAPVFAVIPDSLSIAFQINGAIGLLPEIVFSDPTIMTANTPVGSANTNVDVSNVQPMALHAAIGIGQNGGGVAAPDAFGNTIVANNSAVFSDVLVLPVAAASKYEVLVRAIYIADAAADMKMQFTCTGNATLEWGVSGAGPGVAQATVTGIGIPRRSRCIADAEIVGGIGTYANPAPVVALATTVNIVLTGEQVIDGVLTAGSRVLVKNQTATAQNGIYVSAAGAWVRAVDMDVAAEFTTNALVTVTGGTVNAATSWQQQNVVGVVGTDAVIFGAPGMIAEIRGTLTTAVGGNFRFRAAQQTAAANNLWAMSGTSMTLRKIA